MSQLQIEECLSHLRKADLILMEQRELALACHLSLVIDLLSARLERTQTGGLGYLQDLA